MVLMHEAVILTVQNIYHLLSVFICVLETFYFIQYTFVIFVGNVQHVFDLMNQIFVTLTCFAHPCVF